MKPPGSDLQANASPSVAANPGFDHLVRRSKAERRGQLYALLLLVDLGAIALGFLIASHARLQHGALDQIGDVLPVVLVLFALIAFNRGAYDADVLVRWRAGLRRALTGLAIATLTVVAIGFAWRVSSEFSRLFLALGVAASAALLVVARWGVHRVVRLALPHGPIEQVILSDGSCPFTAAGRTVLDTRRLGLRPDLGSPAALDRLGCALRQADRVIVACAIADREHWVTALKCTGRDVEILLPEMDGLGVLELGRFEGRVSALVARGQLVFHQRVAKRAFDLIVVLYCLPTLALVWIVVAILIKLEDGGPVLFVQPRIGQGNRTFDIYKFRTMRVAGADRAGVCSTARDDARLTRVGRILRRTSLDEVPQMLNVLKGDMSIVGPRPHAVGSTASGEPFWIVDRRYWLRHAAKPGLTGLAQVRGWRGATHQRDALINRIQSDLEYLSGWSIWRDVWILVATTKVVVHEQAY